MNSQAVVVRVEPGGADGVDLIGDVREWLLERTVEARRARWTDEAQHPLHQARIERHRGYELAGRLWRRKLGAVELPDYAGALRDPGELLALIEGVRGQAQADAECSANEETYRRLIGGGVQLYDELVAFLRERVLP